MKKIILLGFFLACICIGCSVGNVSQSGGLDNLSYLQFVRGGSNNYRGGVEVVVDNNPTFIAKVDKLKPLRVKGNTYVIKSGSRSITVSYKGEVLYNKTIMIGSQETKQIVLP